MARKNLIIRMIEWISGRYVKTVNTETIFGAGNIAGGGGGGDVTKAYVDSQDELLQEQITTNKNNITNIKNGASIDSFGDVEADLEAIDVEIEKKLNKLTTGSGLYSHNGETQGEVQVATSITGSTDKVAADSAVKDFVETYAEPKLSDNDMTSDLTNDSQFSVVDTQSKNNNRWKFSAVWKWITGKIKTTMSSSPTDTDILSEKAVKDYVDSKDPLKWNYVGILSAALSSVINVKDDWTELLLAIRVTEGSSTYNLTNVIPKDGFTRGDPTGKQTFAGFFWNESYSAKVRIGLEGSGNSQNLKLNYSQAVGWVLNGIYVLKR